MDDDGGGGGGSGSGSSGSTLQDQQAFVRRMGGEEGGGGRCGKDTERRGAVMDGMYGVYGPYVQVPVGWSCHGSTGYRV